MHLAIYWAATINEPWFEPLISERLAISFWQAMPYIALWFLLISPKHRHANLRRITVASATMLALYAATAAYGQGINIQAIPWLRNFYNLQWPLVFLTFWYVAHCMLPQGSIRFGDQRWGWFKESRLFMWTPWLQLLWTTFLLWDNLRGEYDQLFFRIVLVGSWVYLPLLFLALLGQHLPGTRTVANIGNGSLLLVSLVVLGGLSLFSDLQDPIFLSVILPLFQMLVASVTTLAAYIILKSRANNAISAL